MSRISFGTRGGRIRTQRVGPKTTSTRSAEEIVRELKQQKTTGEDYRERSLVMHGLVCARCAREFDQTNRHLLTVHHKDGNHQNNPADGSNWENLCAYCHEDVHSRGLLGDYLEGVASERDVGVVFEEKTRSPMGTLGERLKKAMTEKTKE